MCFIRPQLLCIHVLTGLTPLTTRFHHGKRVPPLTYYKVGILNKIIIIEKTVEQCHCSDIFLSALHRVICISLQSSLSSIKVVDEKAIWTSNSMLQKQS